MTSLVIRLGLALGSKGDAFVAKRRKNPWVRVRSGETKKEVYDLSFVIRLGLALGSKGDAFVA